MSIILKYDEKIIIYIFNYSVLMTVYFPRPTEDLLSFDIHALYCKS